MNHSLFQGCAVYSSFSTPFQYVLSHELQSERDGVLLKIVAQEGDDVPVKGILAYIGEAGERVTAAPAAAAPATEDTTAMTVATMTSRTIIPIKIKILFPSSICSYHTFLYLS